MIQEKNTFVLQIIYVCFTCTLFLPCCNAGYCFPGCTCELGKAKCTIDNSAEANAFRCSTPEITTLQLTVSDSPILSSLKLANCSEIVTLKIMGKYTYVQEQMLTMAPNIETLHLRSDTLHSIRNEIWETVPHLRKLIIDDCKSFSHPGDIWLIGFENVKHLELTSNSFFRISWLQPELVKLDNLKSLDISGNNLSLFYGNEFHNLHNLDMLKINNNKLSALPWNLFHNLEKLTILELRMNKLKEFSFWHLDALSNLVHLDLSQNKISTFQINTCSKSFNLVDLSQNTPPLYPVINWASCKSLNVIKMNGSISCFTDKSKPVAVKFEGVPECSIDSLFPDMDIEQKGSTDDSITSRSVEFRELLQYMIPAFMFSGYFVGMTLLYCQYFWTDYRAKRLEKRKIAEENLDSPPPLIEAAS